MTNPERMFDPPQEKNIILEQVTEMIQAVSPNLKAEFFTVTQLIQVEFHQHGFSMELEMKLIRLLF